MPYKQIINNRATGQWIAQVRQQGRRTRKVFPSKRAAQAWEVATKRQDSVLSTPIAMVSLIEFADAYLEYCVRFSAKVYSEKRRILQRLLAGFGPETPVQHLTPGQILAFLQRQCRQRSGHAANKERKNLVAAWNWGRTYLDDFPASANPFLVPKFPEERSPRYVPSEADFWQVFAVAEGQDKVLLLTFVLTAGRRGEVYRLRWADVDFARQRLRLATRKRQDGSMDYDWIHMDDVLSQALREHQRTAQAPWVFTQPDGRRKGKPYGDYRGFPQNLCQGAGVQPFGCHAIRHLTASLLAQHNTPLVLIQQMLRHKKLGTTERYIHSVEPLRPYLRVLAGGLQDTKAPCEPLNKKRG